MRTLTLITLTLILFSCQKEITINKATASTQSQAAQVTHQTIFLSFDTREDGEDWWDPCTSEYVHLTGGITVEATNVYTAGKINSTVTFNYHTLVGIGDGSGWKYQGMGVLRTNALAVWNADSGYYQLRNSNTIQHIMLTVPGTHNNLFFTHSFKWAVDANLRLIFFDEKLVYDKCQ